MAELSSLEVLVTRPLAQAKKWQEDLRHRGAQTHCLPVMEITPAADPAGIQAIKTRILDLADYSKVIFVSQNAVQYALRWMDRYWPRLPVGIQYFAVGSSTANLAGDLGLEVEVAGQAMNSEALLQLPALQTVKHEKILICRGVGGRNYLSRVLTDRGAQVDYCELYHRQIPENATQGLRQLLQRWEETGNRARERVLSVHSGESLQNLNELIDAVVGSEPGRALRVKEMRLLVPGARVAELAGQLGFHRVLVADNATDEAMSRALLESSGTGH